MFEVGTMTVWSIKFPTQFCNFGYKEIVEFGRL